MLKTAVQLRDDQHLRCMVWRGSRCETAKSKLGDVAIFSPGQTVLYTVAEVRKRRAYVFRTIEISETESAKIPGVYPVVKLLITARKPEQVTRLLRLCETLDGWDSPIEGLSDEALRRINTLLEQRSFTVANLRKVIKL